MASANLTRRILSLGARGAVTGWCAQTFTEATIKGLLEGEDGNWVQLGAGHYTPQAAKLDTPDVVYEGDEVEDAFNNIYRIKTCRPISWLNQFDRYRCSVEKRYISTYPATYGTGATVEDSRYRTKVYLQTYLTAANLTKDDGVTNASYFVAYDGIPYHLVREFIDNNIDLIFTVKPSTVDVHLAFDPVSFKFIAAYAYTEHVPICITVADKATVSGENLKNKAEQELRSIASAYPNGSASIRNLNSGKKVESNILGIYSYEYELIYKRANDSYDSNCTITYGDNQASSYTFPNITNINLNEPDIGDIRDLPPSRIGDILQILGMSDYEITITCDLSVEPAAKTWKRPQSSISKTDTTAWEVFAEIKFGGKTDSDQIYQNLNLYGANIPVRLTRFEINEDTLTVVFKHYSDANGSSGTYSDWFGL